MPIDGRLALGIQPLEYHSKIGALSQLAQLRGVLSQQDQAEQVRGIMSQASGPEEAIPLLMKAGPAGIQAAGSLAQLLERSTKAKEASEKAAFFSPQNQRQYVEGGRPAVELPEDMTGPRMDAQPGQMNFGRMLQDAASRNFVPPETYANHLAQREQAREAGVLRRDTLEQNAVLRREAIAKDIQLAREKAEDKTLSVAQQNQARMDMIRLTASLRQAPAPPPLESIVGPDGKPVLVPRAQAIGQTPAGRGAAERAMPPSSVKNLFENQQNLRRAEQALSLLQGKTEGGDPTATGVKGFLSGFEIGDVALQKLDPKGVDTRAAIADLGSMIIHDRSGAAVTAAEYPRLRPFIPKVTDDFATAEKKLKRFVSEYRNVQQETTEFFKESGYKVPSESLRPVPDGPAPSRRASDRSSDIRSRADAILSGQ